MWGLKGGIENPEVRVRVRVSVRVRVRVRVRAHDVGAQRRYRQPRG